MGEQDGEAQDDAAEVQGEMDMGMGAPAIAAGGDMDMDS